MLSKDAGRPIKSAAGFTVIELLVVIAAAGVLVALGLPSVNRLLLDSRRAAAVNELVSALNFSRGLAISSRTNITVCRSDHPGAASPSCDGRGDWRTGWIVFRDDDADGVLDSDEILIRQHEPLSDSAQLNGNANIQRRVTFRPHGVTQNNGRIAYCDSRGWSDDARIIVVSVGGRVRAIRRTQDDNAPLPGCVP